jgi:8-oxo-dGTP diphosphatase
MDLKTILEQKSKVAWEIYIPSLSIDCVVFGFDKMSLKVLTLKMKDTNLWAMPGGYIRKNENLHDAATRILLERTGAHNIYLQQFRVFGDNNRTENFFDGFDETLWHKQRFLSIGFYALVDYTKVNLVVDDTSDACQWMSINEIPKLMMDHQSILDKALLRLRKELNHKPIGLNLLPEKFTFPELQKLYCATTYLKN